MKICELTEILPNTCIDHDGNVIRKGMTVVSGGEVWVVGSAGRKYVRLDRKSGIDGCPWSRLVGYKRLSCVHVIGFTSELVFK